MLFKPESSSAVFFHGFCIKTVFGISYFGWGASLEFSNAACIYSEQQGSGFALSGFSDVERHLPISLKPSGIPCCYFSAMNVLLKRIQSQHCVLSCWCYWIVLPVQGLAWCERTECGYLPVMPSIPVTCGYKHKGIVRWLLANDDLACYSIHAFSSGWILKSLCHPGGCTQISEMYKPTKVSIRQCIFMWLL